MIIQDEMIKVILFIMKSVSNRSTIDEQASWNEMLVNEKTVFRRDVGVSEGYPVPEGSLCDTYRVAGQVWL
ncbi:hypothetical protein ABHV46_05770 [Asaia sp. BMEF1]